MFKKIILLILISLLLVGCNSKSETLHSDAKDNLNEEIIDFQTENIVLSKGFQATETNVEAKREGEYLKLTVTAGVVECSGINIDKITKIGNTINLYISALFEKDKIQLVIPQATILIEESINTNIEDLTFNIIPQNYENISLKYNKTQIIDRICGEFSIETNTIPQIELIKNEDSIQWDVFFTNLVHKDNYESPLFNLQVNVDAITGEIIDYTKDIISTYIDQGTLLDYLPDKFILYKKLITSEDEQYESLWMYDINSKDITKIYTTKNTIQNAYFNSTGKYVGLIEKNESESDVYIIEMDNYVAYKITPQEHFNTKLIRWKNAEEIYIADIGDKMTTMFKSNIENNQTFKIFETSKIIDYFDVFDNMIVFTETDELAINKNIFIIEDDTDVKQIGIGFKPRFFDEKNIMYIKNGEDMSNNMLKLYDMEKNSVMNILDYNIEDYYIIDNENILFIENINYNNKFNLVEYNLKDKAKTSVYTVNSSKLFYNLNGNEIYLNLNISNNDEKVDYIYCLDLSKTIMPN